MMKKVGYLIELLLILLTMLVSGLSLAIGIDMTTVRKNTLWFEQGNPRAAHQIYVIAEPNCVACHYLYGSVHPYIANGSLKVRWIMVAFLKTSSLGRVAGIVSSGNPAMALERDETRFNVATEEGGLPVSPVSPFARKVVATNLRFMRAHGFEETPVILFRSSGGRMETLRGAPGRDRWPGLMTRIGKMDGDETQFRRVRSSIHWWPE